MSKKIKILFLVIVVLLIAKENKMIRQYIGARYTPKFMGVYDPTTQYENLCVVDNGAGTSYISNKLVPPNTPLTNTEYWTIYGASSGAILDLQSRVNHIEGIDIPTINSSILRIGGEISDINDSIDSIEGNIEELQTAGTPFEYSDNDDIIIIGDSWTTGLHGNDHGYGYWLPQMLPNHDHFVKGGNGGGFVATDSNNKTFINLLQDITELVSNKNRVKHIIVLGGLNDTGLTGVSAAIEGFKTYAFTNYPNATLEIIIANRTQNGNYSSNRYSYIKDYISGSDSKTRVIDVTHDVPLGNWYNTSHLDADGYKLMSMIVADRIKGGNMSSGYSSNSASATFTLDNTKSLSITETAINGNISLKIGVSNIEGSYSVTGLLKNMQFILNKPLNIATNETYQCNISMLSGSTRLSVPAILLYDGSKIIIQVIMDSTYSSFSQIYIQAINIPVGKAY